MDKWFQIVATFLLVLLVVLTAYNTTMDILSRAAQAEKEAARQDAISTILDKIELGRELAIDTYDSYDDIAYGPNVDRIAEQQLIATEFTMQEITLLHSQLSHLADLIAISQ